VLGAATVGPETVGAARVGVVVVSLALPLLGNASGCGPLADGAGSGAGPWASAAGARASATATAPIVAHPLPLVRSIESPSICRRYRRSDRIGSRGSGQPGRVLNDHADFLNAKLRRRPSGWGQVADAVDQLGRQPDRRGLCRHDVPPSGVHGAYQTRDPYARLHQRTRPRPLPHVAALLERACVSPTAIM
jgi:hypothetical protein